MGEPTVTLAKGGTEERTVPISEVVIPDIWHTAMELRETRPKAADAILEVWHIAHSLRRHIAEN